jgi:protein-S-isoprenylcysteine O-methyltransferase Ste14
MNPNTSVNQPNKATDVTRGVVQRMAQVVIQMVVIAGILLAASGKLDWLWLWAYLGVGLVILAFNAIFLVSKDPEAIAERGKVKREQTKGWDWVITRLLIIPGFGAFIVAGLDERFGWSPAYSSAVHLAALLIWALGQLMVTWAIASNRFFEQTARIQDERQQTVATGGAYRLVRHPGYAGMIVGWLAFPVALGTLWAFIPAALSVVGFAIRTALEDRMLQEELPGYKEYAQQTRYRLVPGIW